MTGTNFVSGTTVKIGNKPASVLTLVSATTMIVQVPASVPGPADVVVTNPNGDAVLQNGYTYLSGAPQKIGIITPTMGLINIPRNTPVTVSFSRPVNRTTITTSTFAFSQGASPVAGTFSLAFGDTVVTFTTSAVADRLPPVVLQLLPINAATGISPRTTIIATFSESVNPNTISPTTFRVTSGGTPIAGAYSFSNLNQTITFIPNNPLPPVATVNVSISSVADVVGNQVVHRKQWGVDDIGVAQRCREKAESIERTRGKSHNHSDFHTSFLWALA